MSHNYQHTRKVIRKDDYKMTIAGNTKELLQTIITSNNYNYHARYVTHTDEL